MQDFNYKYNVNDTYMVTYYTGDDAVVVIPDTYYGKPVGMLYDGIFRGHPEIEQIRIPDTVSEIGGFVFEGCTSLKQITLPSQLIFLWQYAFVRSSLQQITIPDGVVRIAPYTFQECRDLQKVILPVKLRRIGAFAFRDCVSLKRIVIGEDTVIAENAFTGCGEVEIIRRTCD